MRPIDADAFELEFIAYFCGDRTEIPPTAQLAVKMLINNAPTIPLSSLRPKGEWIVEENGVIVCSECGEEHEWIDYRASFCEDCGADMRGNAHA